MKQVFMSIILVLIFQGLLAQPNTEIYVMNLRRSTDGLLIENPQNISLNSGYDNQPAFWVDGESLLYARTINGQTDIARYYFNSGNTLIISNTAGGSEYSPTPMPDGRISSVRLDTTGLQLLYAYTFSGKSEVLVADLKIGYHCWISDEKLAAFVLGSPNTLQIINLKTKESNTVVENIGRSLQSIPGTRSFSFVNKQVSPWALCALHIDSTVAEILTPVLGESEDHCWTTAEEILMAQGADIYVWESDDHWKKFADLSRYGIEKITRLALSPDGKRLAIVAE